VPTTIKRRKNSFFEKWFWDSWVSTCKVKLDPCFAKPYTEVNSKWIIDINIRAKTIKFLEENIGANLCDL